MEPEKLQTKREYSVVKSNELIQQSRFELSTIEQKVVLYLISKIEPGDDDFKLYEFRIKEFCEVCGIHEESGRNYDILKKAIKDLRDKSIWVPLTDGTETVVSWIEKLYLNEKGGILKIRLDKDMKPYLLDLHEKFTQYKLLYTLPMKSKYSIRLYEIMKSYEYIGSCEYDIDQLKKMLFAEKYKTTQHFKEKVINIAIGEINTYSDITVTYTFIKQGRAFTAVEFTIKQKKPADERITDDIVENTLDKKPRRRRAKE